MPGVDESRPFIPVNIAVLTVSDTRDLSTDKSGDTLVQRLTDAGHKLADRAIVTDDVSAIVGQLNTWIPMMASTLCSTGGTGLTGRDVTPEAFEQVFEKKIEGFGELFRWLSFQKIGTSTIQSRAMAGCARHLPVRAARIERCPQGCVGRYSGISADFRFRPCNFVEIMPRLREHEGAREKAQAV